MTTTCSTLYIIRFFQNTVEGRIVYYPVVGRLVCDSSSADHRGYWEHDGFGLVGIYKSDWTKIGGQWNSIFFYGRDKKNKLMVLMPDKAGQELQHATMQSLFNRLNRYDNYVFLLIKCL